MNKDTIPIFILLLLITVLLNMTPKERMEKNENDQNPKITIKSENENIKQFFIKLQKVSGVYFQLSEKIENSIKITINKTNTRLKDILDEILVPHGYYYGWITKNYLSEYGDFTFGYYIGSPNPKYIGLDNWPEGKPLKIQKIRSLSNEFDFIRRKKRKEMIKDGFKERNKQRNEQRALENKQREEKWEKEGKIINIKSGKTININKISVNTNKMNNKKTWGSSFKKNHIKYNDTKTSMGFIKKDKSLRLEAKGYKSTRASKFLRFDEVNYYNKNSKVIKREKVDDGYIQVTLNWSNYGITKNNAIIDENGKKKNIFYYKNNKGDIIFQESYKQGEFYFFILDEFGFVKNGDCMQVFYNNKGEKILEFNPNYGDITYGDISKNGENFLFISSFRSIYKFDAKGNEIYNKYLPQGHGAGYGRISDLGYAYFIDGSISDGKTKHNFYCLDNNGFVVWKMMDMFIDRRFEFVNNEKNIIFRYGNIFYLIDAVTGELIKNSDYSKELKLDGITRNGGFVGKNSIKSTDSYIVIPFIKHLYHFEQRTTYFYIIDYNFNLIEKIILTDEDEMIFGYVLEKNKMNIISSKGMLEYEF